MQPETRRFWWRAKAFAIGLLFAVHLFFMVRFIFQPKTAETYFMFFFLTASAIATGYCFYLHWRFMRRRHLYDFLTAKEKKTRTVNGPAGEYWRLESVSGDYILYAWEEPENAGRVQRWRLTDRNDQDVLLDLNIPEHTDLWKKLAENLTAGPTSAPPTRH